MTKPKLIVATLAALFVSIASAEAPQVVAVESPASPAPVVVATAQSSQPAVVTPEIVRELNTPSQATDPVKADDPEDAIDQWYQNFMAKNGWPTYGTDSRGKSYYLGKAPVLLSSSHADYGRALSLAYSKAYMNAVDNFSRSLVVEVTSSIESKLFSDNSSNKAEFTNPNDGSGRGEIESLFAKLTKLAGAKLDEALRELGVDPAEFNAAAPDQKKVLFSNAVVQKSKERTRLALGGINVVGNIAHHTSKGSYVALVIAYSPAIEGVAQSLREGKRPAIAAVGEPLSKQIPYDPKLLSSMYGPHLMIDDQGPVIVSYAFWSPDQGNEQMRSRFRDLAYKQARTEATAQIARFLSLSYSSESESERGEEEKQTLTKSGKDGTLSDAISRVLIDRMSEQSVAKTQGRLVGLRTLHQWKDVDPMGHELVGVVLAYSFAGMDYARNVTSPHRAEPNATKAPGTAKPQGSVTTEGQIKSAIDQF